MYTVRKYISTSCLATLLVLVLMVYGANTLLARSDKIQPWVYSKGTLGCFANGTFHPASVYQQGDEPSFSALVLTLPYSFHENHNSNRNLDVWHKYYPSHELHQLWTIETDLVGLGHAVSTIQMLEKAYNLGGDIALLLEDDAVPFDGETFKKDIEVMLPHWDPYSPILFLGGYKITPSETYNLKTHVTKLRESLGTFGYLVRREHLLCLANHIRFFVRDKRSNYNIENHWHSFIFPNYSAPPILATPLLVDKKSGPFRHNSRGGWEGQREWWKIWRNKNEF
eukprot:TRINITY_DN546_c0_g1_i1.p1 TRINITY_DN546_c0_g1~~TRINITY_DN546_c0_g1_i1.p1  ORF type:complete len:282 (+),score=20.05 TRINITY_DN546_c0_g1_i1:102-947(+)